MHTRAVRTHHPGLNRRRSASCFCPRRLRALQPALAAALGLASAVRLAAAPLHVAPGDTVEEPFAIGTDAMAALPAGWRVDERSAVRDLGVCSDADDTTEHRGGNALSSSAENGIYNFGAGPADTAEDRAVGFLSSRDGLKSGNLYVHLLNHDAHSITGFALAYQVEKYRNGSNPDGFAIQLHTSTNGTDWTSAGPDFHTFFPPDTNCSGYGSAPGAVTGVVDRTLAVTVASGGEFYLAWNYSVASNSTTTSAQAIALDDVILTALGEPGGTINLPPVLTVSLENRAVFIEREVRATATASDPDGDTATLSVSSTNIPEVSGCFDPVSGVFSWTPTCPGEYSVTFTADDGHGGTAHRDLILQVFDGRTPREGGFVWRFDSTEAAATTGTVGVGAGPVTRANSWQVAFLSTECASCGYDGASEGGNGAAALPASDRFDPDASTCLEWTLTPDCWVEVALSGIAFGARSTGSGPQALALYSSLDGFASPLASFSAVTNSSWALHSAALAAAFRSAVLFRLYAWNATGATTANWRVDDLALTFTSRSKRPPALLLIR